MDNTLGDWYERVWLSRWPLYTRKFSNTTAYKAKRAAHEGRLVGGGWLAPAQTFRQPFFFFSRERESYLLALRGVIFLYEGNMPVTAFFLSSKGPLIFTR